MPTCEFKNLVTDEIVEGLRFRSRETIYMVDGVYVQAPKGGMSLSYADNIATLEPLGLTCDLGSANWTIVTENIHGDGTWDVDVVNSISNEVKLGVLNFGDSKGYNIECGTKEFVMASCGGYEIEDTWEGQTNMEWKNLKGNSDILLYNCGPWEDWDGTACVENNKPYYISTTYDFPTTNDGISSPEPKIYTSSPIASLEDAIGNSYSLRAPQYHGSFDGEEIYTKAIGGAYTACMTAKIFINPGLTAVFTLKRVRVTIDFWNGNIGSSVSRDPGETRGCCTMSVAPFYAGKEGKEAPTSTIASGFEFRFTITGLA